MMISESQGLVRQLGAFPSGAAPTSPAPRCRGRRRRCRVPAAAAAADALGPSVSVRSYEQGSKLRGRRMAVNPLEAWQVQLEEWAQHANIWVAARVDDRPLLAAAALAGATAVITSGLDPCSILSHGLPGWVLDWLDLDSPGGLPAVAALAASVPCAAWALRCWVAANAAALRGTAAALATVLSTRSGQPPPAWLANEGGVGARGVGYVAVAARALSLAAVWTLLARDALLAALLASAAAAAPLALSRAGPARDLLATSSGLEAAVLACGVVGAPLALLPALAAGACLSRLHQRAVVPSLERFVVYPADEVDVHITARLDTGQEFDSSEGGPPLRLWAASGAFAGLAQRSLGLAARDAELAAFQNAEWDAERRRQADARAAAAAADAAAADAGDVEAGAGAAPSQPQQQQEGQEGQEAGAEAEAEAEAEEEESAGWRDLQDDLQLRVKFAAERAALVEAFELPLEGLVPPAALTEPHARWRPFLPQLQASLAGAFLGQPTSVEVYNPPRHLGGYWNPDLCWWQPRDQVEAKFGRVPEPGEAFLFPLKGSDARHAVMASVGPVTSAAVQIDANHGVQDRRVVLTLRVLRIRPGAAPEEAMEPPPPPLAATAAAEGDGGGEDAA